MLVHEEWKRSAGDATGRQLQVPLLQAGRGVGGKLRAQQQDPFSVYTICLPLTFA